MAPTLDDFVRKEGKSSASELSGREVGLKPAVTTIFGAKAGRISRTKSGEGFDTHKLELIDGPLAGLTMTFDNGKSDIYTELRRKES